MEKQSSKQTVSVNVDFRVVSGVLLIIIAGMLAWWQPWADQRAADRTIEVTGQAQLTATPDEFVFSPSYEFKNADKDAALKELAAKSEQVVAKLKELGVPDEKIKTNSSGYDYTPYYLEGSTPVYSLQLTITVDKTLAQSVQDYLVNTSPMGSVSPQATFSNAKQKELETQAREEATKDARSKAEQSAKNLGFELGQVKTVNDGVGFGGGIAYPTIAEGQADDLKLSIQPGENELNYNVMVAYYLR